MNMHGDNTASSSPSIDELPLNVPFRRWERSVFFSADQTQCLITAFSHFGKHNNAKSLDADLLLFYRTGEGWVHSGWSPKETGRASLFRIRELDQNKSFLVNAGHHQKNRSLKNQTTKSCAATIRVQRLSSFCPPRFSELPNGCWVKWQAEGSLRSSGELHLPQGIIKTFDGFGSRAILHGKWDWSAAPGWIAFVVDSMPSTDLSQQWSAAFILVQTPNCPENFECNIVLWQNGKLQRTITRRHISVSVNGAIDRNDIDIVPFFSKLLPPPATIRIPQAINIIGRQAEVSLSMRFEAKRAARIILPSETGDIHGMSHQVIGTVTIDLKMNGEQIKQQLPTVVEFGSAMVTGGNQ